MDSIIENSWRELIYSAFTAPLYHIYFEVILILGIVWLFFKSSYKPSDRVALNSKEKEELLAEWTPDPLVPADWTPPENILKSFRKTIVSPLGKYVRFADTPTVDCLNLASLNFLNFVGDSRVGDTAVDTLRKYGVGSCGPRGFYGTMDVHLNLEDQLAAFLNCEESIVYSYGFSTVASAIPAYAKRTDVIFADEGVCFAIQKGLVASRSRLKFFRHNDMADLERLLELQEAEDKKDPKRVKATQRFIIVEGLYMNYGDICPLTELVELKFKYKVRLFIDESLSFGVLGNFGRGVTEYYGLPIRHVDLISGSLEYAIGSCGGFCAGTKYVIDHQRLSGQGYCFSASLPPLLATSASCALDQLAGEEGERCRRLRGLSEQIHARLTTGPLATYWTTGGHKASPVKHLRLASAADNTTARLETAVEMALGHSLLLTVARYLEESENIVQTPSIRLCLNCDLTEAECDKLYDVLEKVGQQLQLEAATN